VLTIQGLGPSASRVEAAAAELSALLAEHCAATCRSAVAEAGRPVAELYPA
jgi:hypothetical protein